MDAITERIFDRRYQRGVGFLANVFMAGMATVGFMAAVTLALPFLVLVGPGAAALGGALVGTLGGIMGIWVGLDHFGLLGNQRLRRRVEEKLESLAELPFDPRDRNVRFVGLSHPCREKLLRWETDDDVGFLQITPDGLRYRGDSLSFDIPVEELVAVELVPVGGMMPRSLKRVRITLRHGEPFDAINFDSRQFPRYFLCQRDTHSLFHQLRALVRQVRREASILAEEMESPVRLEREAEGRPFHLTEESVEWEEDASSKVRRA